jgi:hypothetical protein
MCIFSARAPPVHPPFKIIDYVPPEWFELLERSEEIENSSLG